MLADEKLLCIESFATNEEILKDITVADNINFYDKMSGTKCIFPFFLHVFVTSVIY